VAIHALGLQKSRPEKKNRYKKEMQAVIRIKTTVPGILLMPALEHNIS